MHGLVSGGQLTILYEISSDQRVSYEPTWFRLARIWELYFNDDHDSVAFGISFFFSATPARGITWSYRV